jgi:hypothetical protein
MLPATHLGFGQAWDWAQPCPPPWVRRESAQMILEASNGPNISPVPYYLPLVPQRFAAEPSSPQKDPVFNLPTAPSAALHGINHQLLSTNLIDVCSLR